MKTLIKTTIAAVVLSAAFAGNVSAMVSAQSLKSTVQSVLGAEGQVQVTLDNGVATLFGHVNESGTKHRINRAVSNYPGVDRVVNLIADS